MELQIIQQKIYEIRGLRVMLDVDLAELYGVETKRLKEAVRRNMERFPSDFMFELTENEFKILRPQIASSSWGGARYPPFAFTEHGVAMLSGLLNSPKAIETNIAIVRAFIALRRFALTYAELSEKNHRDRSQVRCRNRRHPQSARPLGTARNGANRLGESPAHWVQDVMLPNIPRSRLISSTYETAS
ncbi:MAG: ORF6N domain-containing protein [Saprospiraceae bacterium]